MHNFRLGMRTPHPSKDVTSGSHIGHAQWYILYYYYSQKKAQENDVTSGHVTSGDITYGSSTS